MSRYNKLCSLIKDIDELVRFLSVQDYYNGMNCNSRLVNNLTGIIVDSKDNRMYAKQYEDAARMLLEAQESRDYVALSDICSMRIRKLCVQELEDLRKNGTWQEIQDYYESNYAACNMATQRMLDQYGVADASDIPDRYALVENEIGTFSLKLGNGIDGDLLFDSTDNPYLQAEAMVDYYCTESTAKCVIFGLGMGYIAMAAAKREDIVEVEVYEHDINVIKAAMHYSNLADMLSDGKVTIVYTPRLAEFSKRLSQISGEQDKATTIIIHRPSMMNISNEEMRLKLEDFFLHDSSVRSQQRKLSGNYIMNMQDTDAFANELREKFSGKNVLLIAGGPSLDDNLDMLESCATEYIVTEYGCEGVRSYPLSEAVSGEDYIVVCVGTVLRNLISCGIKPDYVVMIDAQPNMVRQIEGVDTSGLSLVYLPTVYYKVPKLWTGRRYMAFQKGFAQSEFEAERRSLELFESGGSVTTLALDMCLRFGCEKIVCMGMDFAYTDGKRHSSETSVVTEKNGLRQVKSVAGGDVTTAVNLDNYRIWVERRLAARTDEERKTKLINVSRGAYIEGMNNITQWM